MGKKFRTKEVEHTNCILPLGVSKQGEMVNFSVSIPHTKECKLILYQGSDINNKKSISLRSEHRYGNVFSIQFKKEELTFDSYRYEARGKEFIDPYATRIIGREDYGKVLSSEEKELVRGGWDFDVFDWESDRQLNIPYSKMFLYKLHVRGFTKDQSSLVKHKGTYLGIIEKIPYLKELGINAILLMPCVEFNEVIEDTISHKTPSLRNGIRYQGYVNEAGKVIDVGKVTEDLPVKLNFWGYTEEYQYFAPKASYAFDTSQATKEYKMMVKELHKNGIEVLMEMHFNSRVNPLLILDCLRFWAMEYHVDGFRLTNQIGIDQLIAMDPYLSRTKILYSNWNTDMLYERDVSLDYKNLAEYQDGFLIDTRKFLKGDEEQIGKFTEHFRCNPAKKGRINYLTDNNGFTLMDLYSYDVKHNEMNGENNRDGTDYNYSWNCGAEGVTRKKKVNELRIQMRKNALVVLILSQGVPMLLAGDELGNSQEGNNNAYCQDNAISWVQWKGYKHKDSLFTFTKELISLKKNHKVLRNEQELRVMDYISCGYPDISFHGTKAWCPEYINHCRTLGILLCGNYAVMDDNRVDNFFYFAFNMHWEAHQFDLPDLPKGLAWTMIVVTDAQLEPGLNQNINSQQSGRRNLYEKQSIVLNPRSIAIFMSRKKDLL